MSIPVRTVITGLFVLFFLVMIVLQWLSPISSNSSSSSNSNRNSVATNTANTNNNIQYYDHLAKSKGEEDRFNDLLSWLQVQEHATVNRDLFEIKQLPDFGNSLLATKDLKPNTILFRLRQESILDKAFVFEKLLYNDSHTAKTNELLVKLKEGDLSLFNAMVLMIIYLYRVSIQVNKLDRNNVDPAITKFMPYIASLPRPFQNEAPKVGFLFNGDQFSLLKGSTLLPSLILRRHSIGQSFKNVITPILKDLKIMDPIRNDSVITLALFEHFVSLSWSRLHSIFDNRLNDSRPCFVPLGDLLNFSKRDVNVLAYTDEATNELIFKVTRPVAKGQQLFVKYGKMMPTLNHFLITDYGFCTLDDTHEEFLNNTITVVDFKDTVMQRMGSVDKHLNAQRVKILSTTSLDEYHLTQSLYFIDDSKFSLHDHNLSEILDPNIIAVLRILACNDAELKPLIEISTLFTLSNKSAI